MKIVGQLVCGPGEADRYLEATLQDLKRLTDDAVICLAGDPKLCTEEEKLCKKYGFWVYNDTREWGRHQPSIKSDLLKKIFKLRPDWILVLDADETLPETSRDDLESLAQNRESCFFYVVNLWDDEHHYKKSMSFWNVRFYKADPSKGSQFLRKPVHCGNAPPYFYNQAAKASYVPHILEHRGLMLAVDRAAKAQRYAQYDPQAEHKGREYYDALVATGAPASYTISDVKRKIEAYCSNL